MDHKAASKAKAGAEREAIGNALRAAPLRGAVVLIEAIDHVGQVHGAVLCNALDLEGEQG